MALQRGEVCSKVASLYGREYCVLAGRGTTALKVLFDVLGIEGEVVFPAYTCEAPVYAALYEDLQPRFCDVSYSDLTLDTENLPDRLNDQTSAVVPVHTLGHPVDIDDVLQITNEWDDITVVEDACQLFPQPNHPRCGVKADVTVLSFGYNKPIDAEGGGAILLDDAELAAKLRDRMEAIPEKDTEYIRHLAKYEKSIRHTVDDLTTHHPEGIRLLEQHHDVFREVYIRSVSDEIVTNLSGALDSLSTSITAHKERAEIYSKRLKSPNIQHPDPAGDPVKNHYAVRLSSNELRNYVVSELRKQDFHVSTYHSLPYRFNSCDSCECAREAAERTLHLWITDRLSKEYVHSCSEVVLNAIAEWHEIQ